MPPLRLSIEAGESGHQLPWTDSASSSHWWYSRPSFGPIRKVALGLLGGFTMAAMWPLLESTLVCVLPRSGAARYAAFDGAMWSSTPATT